MSIDDLTGILRFLAPGFIAIKSFSWFGRQYRRTDLELTVWGVLAAWAITSVVGRLGIGDQDLRLAASLVAGVLLGFVVGRLWRLIASRSERFRTGASGRVWDFVFDRSAYGGVTPYVEERTTSGQIVFGWAYSWALEAQAGELDLLIRDPMWVDDATGERIAMAGINGVLLLASTIEMVRVYDTETGQPGSWAHLGGSVRAAVARLRPKT